MSSKTVSSNRELEMLGWDPAIVDRFTFELIIALLEDEGSHEIPKSAINYTLNTAILPQSGKASIKGVDNL